MLLMPSVKRKVKRYARRTANLLLEQGIDIAAAVNHPVSVVLRRKSVISGRCLRHIIDMDTRQINLCEHNVYSTVEESSRIVAGLPDSLIFDTAAGSEPLYTSMSSSTSTVTQISCNPDATALLDHVSESDDLGEAIPLQGEEQYLAELEHIHRGILPIPATVEEWLSQSNDVLMQVCEMLNIGSFDDILVNSELATVTNRWWGEVT